MGKVMIKGIKKILPLPLGMALDNNAASLLKLFAIFQCPVYQGRKKGYSAKIKKAVLKVFHQQGDFDGKISEKTVSKYALIKS